MRVYLVQRRHWEFNDDYYGVTQKEPLKAFQSAEDAGFYRDQCEHTERRRIEQEGIDPGYSGTNPFLVFDPQEAPNAEPVLSSLPEEELVAWLQSQGLPCPAKHPEEYGFYEDNWWASFLQASTTEQRDAFWDRLDYVQLFEVVEVELEDT
ncbi:hypothetical protein [Armatimonas rosea]|uniref:Uncharacterized protein n=1 Tax=Armatimonas rosea TaxID=685828 RepID=A0A7W9SN51_ARMRO|nr:hypothetical protein [Armatimonas rosea]MBB6048914.1 hypothetical protein [Armatimonas rosea]